METRPKGPLCLLVSLQLMSLTILAGIENVVVEVLGKQPGDGLILGLSSSFRMHVCRLTLLTVTPNGLTQLFLCKKKAPRWGRGPSGHRCSCSGQGRALCSLPRACSVGRSEGVAGLGHRGILSQVKLCLLMAPHPRLCPQLLKQPIAQLR